MRRKGVGETCWEGVKESFCLCYLELLDWLVSLSS